MGVLGTLPSSSPVALNFVRTRSPLAGDDSSTGIAVGSFWTDSTSQRTWICQGAALGAAIWKEVVAAPTPPPGGGGTLRWSPPPGWNGGDPTLKSSFPTYQERTITGPGTLSLTNGVDYYIHMGALAWSGNQRIVISGGRHIVLCGGAITYTNSPSDGGDVGLQIDGGTPGGIVHLEGIKITNQPNGFTIRTPRIVQIQNCWVRVKVYQDNTSIAHPDLVQVWMQNNGNPGPNIRINRCSFYSGFTYLTDFTDESGVQGDESPHWELYDLDMHGIPPDSGAVPLIGLNNWMGHRNSIWEGDNLWLETSYESSGNRRDLGDQLRQRGLQYSVTQEGYQILDAAGTVLYTQAINVQSGAPGDIGRTAGHRLVYHLDPNAANIEWKWGVPSTSDGADSAGNFCSAAIPGANYISPLYT